MRLAALLAWYDEQPWYLRECVESLAGVVDHLIAVDGAYQDWPNPQARSPSEQAAAIVEASTGIHLTLHEPPTPFIGNEIAKRQAMFEFAKWLHADWVLVIDADERVVFSDPSFRDRLEDVHGFNVGVVRFRTERDMVYDGDMRRLFRVTPGLRVSGRHGIYVDDTGQLCGDGGGLAPAVNCRRLLTIDHRQTIRTAARDADRHQYVGSYPEG